MLTTAGLFAGIGGIEEGLRRAGLSCQLLCEIDPTAQTVLKHHFPDVRLVSDVKALRSIPRVDLVTAGFPCQDLSQAGRTRGIFGRESGLVRELFRILSSSRNRPKWLLLENVPFMLRLRRGQAMRFVTGALDELGYTWAYRVVDTRAFGLPQRRQRVLILASRTEDPRAALLTDDVGQPDPDSFAEAACGFYWTEGNRGVGWAVDAIPALKPGSRLAIPSAPAIWLRKERSLVMPDIRDAERLQGFPVNWTKVAEENSPHGRRARWRLVGNAVSAPVATWIGRRIQGPSDYDDADDIARHSSDGWGTAGWGRKGECFVVERSTWPVNWKYRHLHEFLLHSPTPLSHRAANGFLSRAKVSNLRFEEGFLKDVAHHVSRMSALSQ